MELLAGYAVGQVLGLSEGIEFVEALNGHHEALIVQGAMFVFYFHFLKVLDFDIAHKLFKFILSFKFIICFRQYF